MTLASLPTLSVQIAFTPTNIQSLTQTWTDVTPYVRDFTTKLGRQHFLDRVEAGTLNMTVNERTGFFLNGSVNGTGYVIQPRLPIKVTATWSGTTYPVFYGLIDSIDEKITDQLNVDLTINATDLVKFLSLRYMASTNFWSQYVNGTSATDWYRFTAPAQVICTSAVNASGTVTYQGINNFSAGQQVFVTGFSGTGDFNTTTGASTVQATGLSPSQFVLSGNIGSTSGNSAGTGSAYLATLANSLNPSNTGYAGYGTVAFPPNGAMVYSNDGCLDLANGQKTASGVAVLNGYGSIQGSIDFWVLGQDIAGTLLFSAFTTSAFQIDIKVSAAGYLTVVNHGTSAVITTNTTAPINDGYWHHVGLVNNTSNQLCLYVDGNLTVIGGGAYSGWYTNTDLLGHPYPLVIGGINYWFTGTSTGALATAPCFIDELVISSNNYLTLTGEVINRYVAGTLLSKGFPVTANGVLSGDRIAEVLCIAGFGIVTGGQVVLNSNTYFINDSATAWVNGASGNGFIAVEPWYWDSPVTGSTALDLILQICDTDIGSFYQETNGTFSYYNQLYYGYWSWTSSSTSLTVGTGTQTFVIPPGVSFTPGTNITLSNPVSSMIGTVTTYASGPGSNYTLTVNITSFTGSGTQSTWNISSWSPNSYTPTGDHVWTDDTSSTYHYYGPSLQVVRDDVDVWTTVKVSPQSGTEQIYENTANESRWGYSTLTKSSTVHTTLSLALSTANFLGNLFKTPLPRVGNVELRSETNNGQNMTALLNTEFGDVVTFKRNSPNSSTTGSYPDQQGLISTNMVVESISYDFQADPGYLHASFILDPYPIRS